MSSTELKQLENSIKQAQKLVDLGDSLERLRSNRDFKKIFLEGYFDQEAIRLVHLRADSNMQSAESRKSIDMQIDAIGTVHQYLNTISVQAQMARRGLAADEQTRDELLLEGK